MNTRNFAMILGVVFVVVGVLGFVPGINQMHDDHEPLTVGGPGHGLLLGLFHVNVLHNAVHLLFGALGIAMSRTWPNAVLYCRIVAVAYLLLAVLGLIPTANINHTFGLIPIEGWNVGLHALIGAAAAYFGWAAPKTAVM